VHGSRVAHAVLLLLFTGKRIDHLAAFNLILIHVDLLAPNMFFVERRKSNSSI
jgi:hypothetical protein